MGVTTQQHRAVTGMFAGLLATSSGRRSSRRRKSGGATNSESVCNGSSLLHLFLAVIFITYTGLICRTSLSLTATSPQSLETVIPSSTSSAYISDLSDFNQKNVHSFRSLLLLLANDVELNPGPEVTANLLMEGLAQLAVDAPAGQVKHIILSWSPDKDVRADIDKQYRAPELKQTLAWLRNCSVDDTFVKSKKKAEVLDALLIAIERLLPDQCGMCKEVYSVDRTSNPALQCGGCHQGFHDKCLETAFGSPSLPQLPGMVHWLCDHCTPRFSLMTVVGADGKTEKPRSKRNCTANQPGQQPGHQPGQQPGSQPGPQPASTADEQPAQQTGDEPDNPPPPPDCPLLMRNECPHGQSGKKDGQCQYKHRPRCNKYMKWGDKSVNGCKSVPCDKLHPLLCPRSLDLKCFEKACDVKLHTRKCKRARPTQSDPNKSGKRAVKDAPSGSAPKPAASQTSSQGGVPSQWQPPAVPYQYQAGPPPAVPYQYQAGPPVQAPSQWYPPGVPPPIAGVTGGLSNQWIPPPGVQYVQPPGHPGNWHSLPGTWPVYGQPSTTASAPWSAPTSGQGLPQTSGLGSMQSPNFQMGCAVTSPPVHQILEVWATNMAREMARQSEITRGMMFSSVKEMSQHLGGQGGLRPSF